VIERCFVELGNDLVPALMVGVTTRALHTLRCGKPPVKAGVIVHVDADFCMTCDAKLALWQIRQRNVAVLTVLFQVGMISDDRARHNQPFL